MNRTYRIGFIVSGEEVVIEIEGAVNRGMAQEAAWGEMFALFPEEHSECRVVFTRRA